MITKRRPLHARQGAALCNFLDMFIIVTGGRNMQLKRTDGAIEWYSVRDDVWNSVDPPIQLVMNTPRGSHACCTLDRKIYIVGGLDNDC